MGGFSIKPSVIPSCTYLLSFKLIVQNYMYSKKKVKKFIFQNRFSKLSKNKLQTQCIVTKFSNEFTVISDC